jgi:hypothetical protein
MNLTSSTLIPIALLATISSSVIMQYSAPNYLIAPVNSLTETQRQVALRAPRAWDQAGSLFPELRNFTPEERVAYNSGLSKLFQKTGRKLL